MTTHKTDLVPIIFSLADVEAAAKEWGFNCGPGALCAILAMTPAELRPHLGDFERKRYSNPTLMADILHRLRVPFRRVYECRGAHNGDACAEYPRFGLVRIQWAGPWTGDGVPARVRYRHTHWVGVRHYADEGDGLPVCEVFDVNAMCCGGWLSWDEWTLQLVPWLLKECEPKSTGEWWPTHCWEVVTQ